MANHVYRSFDAADVTSISVQTQPQIKIWSGSSGYGGDVGHPSATLSVYGGIRSRTDVGPTGTAGVRMYTLESVQTDTIQGMQQVPSPFPYTGSINFFTCENIPQNAQIGIIPTDQTWYEEHYSVISRLSQWYHDNVKCTYQQASKYPSFFTGFHIPSMFYGRQLATGSILVTVNSFAGVSGTYGSTGSLYWVDDGLGRLWSVTTPTSSWNTGVQVSATVMYSEGIISFTHPDPMWQLRLLDGHTIQPNVTLQFRGVNHIKSMIFTCRLAQGDANGSNNPTYFTLDSAGNKWAYDADVSAEATTYITAIGLYNEYRQLVGVAKLAQPIRKRESDKIDIRLRLDV